MNLARFKTSVVPLYRQLYRLACLMLGVGEDAEDAVQDVYLRLWQMRNDLDKLDSIEAYARTMTKRLCIDRLKTNKYNCDEELNEVANRTIVEPSDFENRDRLEVLSHLMLQLPQSQQTVIRLSSFMEMSNDEIARAMDLSEVNVRQLLSRGRKKLFALMNAYEK